MSDERERVEHPSWCDRENCTAPEYRPTVEEYRDTRGEMVAHRSSPLRAYAGGTVGDMVMSLCQLVTPWDTDVFLELRSGDAMVGAFPISTEGGGFTLYELLGQAIAPLVQKYPTLYAERFPHLADTTGSGDEGREAQDVGEPEEHHHCGCGGDCPPMEADDEQDDEDQDKERCGRCRRTFDPADTRLDGHARYANTQFCKWCVDRCHESMDFAHSCPVCTTTGSSDEKSEAQDVGGLELLEPTFQLTVNSRVMERGTLQEVRLAVVNLVTTRLAAAPERVAADAHGINLAWNSNIVKQALAERGQWFTVLDAHGEDPLRIRVTREG